MNNPTKSHDEQSAEMTQWHEKVQRNGWALLDVPGQLVTQELCASAVQRNWQVLNAVPEILKTAEMCLSAIRQNGLALKFIPKQFVTREFCLTAVEQNARALEDVPPALKTPEIFMAAVRNDEWAIRFIPDAVKTPQFLLEAIKLNFAVVNHAGKNALLQDGSEALHDFLDENWDKVVQTIGCARSSKLLSEIAQARSAAAYDRQVG